jgi:hypothetical protein
MTRVLAALAVASEGAVLAGCGGSGSTSSSATVAATAVTAAVTSTAATSTPGGQPAGASSALAAPGTNFAPGQSATVPYQVTQSNGASGPTYRLRITVQSIERGTLADFNGIQLDADQKASTPYYVRVRMTNLGPYTLKASENDQAGEIQAVDKTDQPQDSVTFFSAPSRAAQTTTRPIRSRTGRASALV